MLPFPVILIGVGEPLASRVKQELTHLSVSVEAEYRGIDTAMEGLAGTQPAKKLLIVHYESVPDGWWLRRLTETFGEWPILALVDVSQDRENLVWANRAGAMQVVPLPFQPEDFREAVYCIALHFRPQAHDCQIIAFTGSAAGCGATTVATNAAYESAAQHKRQTVLIELASQMGVLATNLDVEPACTLAELLADVEHLDAQLVQRSLVQVADNFAILAGSRGVGPAGSGAVAGVLRVLDYVRRLAQVVVLDVPCTFNDLQFEVLGVASQVVLIGDQSIASLRTLKSLLDSLGSPATQHALHVVLNRYDPNAEGFSVRDLEKTLGLSHIHTIPDDHPGVLSAVNQGKPLRQVDPHSPVLAAIDSLVDSLLGKDHPTRSHGMGLFRRLLHAFKK